LHFAFVVCKSKLLICGLTRPFLVIILPLSSDVIVSFAYQIVTDDSCWAYGKQVLPTFPLPNVFRLYSCELATGLTCCVNRTCLLRNRPRHRWRWCITVLRYLHLATKPLDVLTESAWRDENAEFCLYFATKC